MSYDDCVAQVHGPQYLIVEFYHELNKLYVALDQMAQYGCDTTTLMDSLMLCVSDHFEAQCAVEQFCEEIQDAHAELKAPNDGLILSSAVRQLGLRMHQEFDYLGLYGEGGLHYRFYSWHDPHTMVFEKFIETDAYPNPHPGRSYQPLPVAEKAATFNVRLPMANHRPRLDVLYRDFKITGIWNF